MPDCKSIPHRNLSVQLQGSLQSCFCPEQVCYGLGEDCWCGLGLQRLKQLTVYCLQVKVNWRRGLVENSKLDRELLDLPPEKVKAMTAKQQKYALLHALVYSP